MCDVFVELVVWVGRRWEHRLVKTQISYHETWVCLPAEADGQALPSTWSVGG